MTTVVVCGGTYVKAFDDTGSGTPTWSVSIGGTQYCVALDADGGPLVGGTRTSNLTTRHYLPAGSLDWSADHGASGTIYGCAFNPVTGGWATGGVMTTSTTRIYSAAGSVTTNYTHTSTVYAAAFDSTGALITGGGLSGSITTRKYASGGGAQVWTRNHAGNVRGVAVGPSNEIVTGGEVSSDSLTTRRYASDGTEGWTANHGGTVFDVAIDEDGNVITVGARVLDGSTYVTTRKYSPSGTQLWTADHGVVVYGVAIGAGGTIYTTGTLTGGATTRKYSADGALLWSFNAGVDPSRGIAVYATEAPPPDVAGIPLRLSLALPVAGAWVGAPALASLLGLGVPQTPLVTPPDVVELLPRYRLSVGGDPMLVLPVASLQCVRRLGASTFLTVTIPTWTPALESALSARIDGTIVIDAGDGAVWGEFLRAILTEIAMDRTPDGCGITVTGRVQTPSYTAATRRLYGVVRRGHDAGRRTAVARADPLLRPNDTVWDGAEWWTVGQIYYRIAPSVSLMDVLEVAT